MNDQTDKPGEIPFRVQQVESEGRKFAEKYLFPQMQKAYEDGTDPDFALFALMECVSRIIRPGTTATSTLQPMTWNIWLKVTPKAGGSTQRGEIPLPPR